MRKLLMALTAVVMATSVQAAAYYWGVDATPDYTNGQAAGAPFLNDSVYVMLASAWDGNKGTLANALQGPVSYTTDSVQYVNYMDTKINQTSFNYGTADVSGQTLDVIFVDVNAAGDGFFTWSDTLTSVASTDPTGVATYAKSIATSTIAAAYTANGGYSTFVPEPTSGLLMLIGLAGLALKRKKA